ncbi:hypothetical protein [Nocardioides daejeonensis]|uniref:hypothetical protein n=1 Tax=Nocardioides daejeonensis TaxID=1046556 RepID=UPI000D7485E7|nr:hypothetical protein [Nocardioides daejeonensis]
MLFSRARKAVAGAVVSSALVLGATSAVQAAPVAAEEQTVQVAARKAPGKLHQVKRSTTRLAVKKHKAYRKVRTHLTKNAARIPAPILATASKQIRTGEKRLDKLTIKASKAKTVKRAKVVRGKIRAQRPGDVKKLVVIAQRATEAAAQGDAGLLEGLLDDLLGLKVGDGLLGPVIDLVDGLLGSLGGNGGSTGGLLDGLLDLLNNLLGGLLGKR